MHTIATHTADVKQVNKTFKSVYNPFLICPNSVFVIKYSTEEEKNE